jgi:hypothetical protein
MTMMEEGDEALGFEREIYWLSEQAEMRLDSVDRTITEPVHLDRLARAIAALEDIERDANAKASASSQPIGRRRSGRASPP